YACYEARRGRRTIPTVSVIDEFGARTMTVRDPKRVCGPADENNQDATAPADPEHLVGYEVGKAAPRFQPIRNQVVVNEFGSVTVDLAGPQMLMMPSATSLTALPPPLDGTSIDHFQCYKTHGGRTQIGTVPIEDEFGTIQVTVKRPIRLCTPVDASGQGVPNPDARRPACGEYSVNQPSEECDGSDDSTCPGRCLADCTCAPAPMCGDGIVNQPSEECDLSDDSACPGNCSASCTCLP